MMFDMNDPKGASLDLRDLNSRIATKDSNHGHSPHTIKSTVDSITCNVDILGLRCFGVDNRICCSCATAKASRPSEFEFAESDSRCTYRDLQRQWH